MSALEPATECVTLSPQMSRRIAEIMKEKGNAYSQTAIASRINMNRETIRTKLLGESKIYRYELKNIANALHLSVERLMQEDTFHLQQELKSIFDALVNPEKTEAVAQRILWTEATSLAFATGGYVDLLAQRALEIALQLSTVAIGVTERSISLNDLGRAYYHLQQYEEAHKAWLQAYRYAKNLADQKKPDIEPLFVVVTNLMISFSIRKEYSHLEELLSSITHLFESDPARAAVISYSLAKVAENKGNIDEARKQYELYITYSENVPNKHINLGKAKHNTARFEYRLGNFQLAKKLFEDALVYFEHHHFEKITCLKDYSKTLLKLGESEKAEIIISKSIESVDGKSYSDLRAQFMILLSIVREVPEFAESVFEQKDVSEKVRKVAGNYLIDFFDQKGDSSSAMKYYRAMKHFSNGQYDALDEEEL